MVDLRTAEAQDLVGLDEASLRSEVGDNARCQAVASTAHELGAHGIVAPAATGLGETLALFTTHLPTSEMLSVAMMAPGVEAVAELNRGAQRMRATAGEIDLGGPHVVAGGYQIHVGDVVATRRNDRELRTDCGHMVKNRDLWQVAQIKDHGEVVVTGRTGMVCLPADYAKAHVELAYAQTSHANQGRTVDTSLVLGPRRGKDRTAPGGLRRHRRRGAAGPRPGHLR